MSLMLQILHWFTGGENQYMRLYSCMKRDDLWVGLTVALNLSIAVGYSIIALHWWRNQRSLPDVPAKRVLANIRNIFILCGLCGYVFVPIKMFWPAWRLYDIVMVVLNVSTWRYVFSATNMKVVYSELGRTGALAAELEASQKESARKSQFLNALSHDLRTPLNGLALQASVAELAMKNGDMDGIRKAMTEIRASTRATASLLDCFLESARAESAEEVNTPTSFALRDLLGDIGKRMEQEAARKSLSLQIGSAGNLHLNLDRTKLDRILTNLISNAIKFTHEGSIRVKVDRGRAILGGTILARTKHDKDTLDKQGIEIHVIDTGIGISAAEQEKLFDEFFQIKNYARDPAKGFGLGLSIARRLARQMGGDIVVESAPQRGSRFSVLLPGELVSDAAVITVLATDSSATIAPAVV